MKKFGLIGNPIKTSGSPALFKAGYKGKYSYDLIEGDDFETSYGKFLDEYAGVNVTAPFKTDAFRKAGLKSDICRLTGAANLLLKTDEGIMAYNTDYAGVILSILDAVLPEGGFEFFSLYGNDFSTVKAMLPSFYGYTPKALIAGCGGAGRAAAAAAASIGYDTTLVNRSDGKAISIAEDMPGFGFHIEKLGRFIELFKESDLVIYTIPGRIPELDFLDTSHFPVPGKIILEANYKNPSFGTEENDIIRNCKGIYVSGKRWLIYQAITGFRIFTGETPDFAGMCKVL